MHSGARRRGGTGSGEMGGAERGFSGRGTGAAALGTAGWGATRRRYPAEAGPGCAQHIGAQGLPARGPGRRVRAVLLVQLQHGHSATEAR